MKKLFTFAAAILASVAMMAVEPTLSIYDDGQGSETYLKAYEAEGITISSSASFSSGAVQLGNTPSSYDAHYLEVLSANNAIDSISFLISGNGSNKSIQAPLFAWEETATSNTADTYVLLDPVTVTANSYEAAQWFTYNVSAANVKCARIYRTTKYVSSVDPEYTGSSTALGSGQTIKIYGMKIWLNGSAPAPVPVTSVTIDGDTEGYVGSSVKLTATFDAKPDSIFWTVDGAVQENSNSKNFTLSLIAERTYQVACWARNQYNEADQFAASDAFNVVATVKPVLDPVSVSEATVWDWTKAATVSEIKWTDTTTPQKNQEVLLANVDGMNNNAEFNSQALLFSGEYPIRDGKYCQGGYLQFHTTVAGYVQVEFSNTGGGDRPNRYVAVNGVVNTEVGSATATKVTSAYIAVEAGDVKIEGSFDPYEGQYLRIYKVVFGVGDIPTAIDNTEAAVKAVKFFENGQLMIEKNGVIYNAQGAIVK